MSIVYFRTVMPREFATRLDNVFDMALVCSRLMLRDRTKSSTRDWPQLPSVVAKALIRKYQRNQKCRKISKCIIPICGDNGKQVKIVEGGLRIPALFKKAVIPCRYPLPVSGFIRHVELFKRNGQWLMGYCYNTPCAEVISPVSVIGVDRNAVGNIATLAEPRSKRVRFVGFNADRWKENFRQRKARILSQGRKRLAFRLRRKQSHRTQYENHRASKTIVAFAAEHRSAIALEDLKLGKCAKRYADKRQWAHAQLQRFIEYKAALRGVPIIFVNPAFTSQDCSRCGSRNKPDSKSYSCKHCGHKTHRDANSAFNIAFRGADMLSGGNGDGLNVPLSGCTDAALYGKVGQSDA